jgi:YbbR domain-containing protein
LSRSTLRDLFLKDATLKVFSLLLALSLWLFVVGEKKSEFGFAVPVELRNLPPRLIVSKRVPPVDVRIVGPRNILDGLSPQDLKISIDLETVQAGEVTFANLADRIDLPRSVAVSSISPANVTVTLEDLVERKVKVDPMLKGSPEENFEVGQVVVKPGRVDIRVAKSQAPRLRSVKTKVVDISGIAEDYERRVGLDLAGFAVGSVEPDEVTVQVALKEKVGEKEFLKVSVETVNSAGVARVEPAQAGILLRGPLGVLGDLDEKRIGVILDLEGKAPGKHIVKARVNVPPKTALVRVEPEEFEVTIARQAR